MNRFYSLLFLLNLAFSLVSGQNDSVSIVQCFRSARENATLKPQLEIMAAISELEIDNASSTNLPALSAYGKGWYQSDAIKVPGPNGIAVNQLQYNFGLEADQKIYDGGMARKSKAADMASAESDKNKIEIDLYKLNDRVLTYFFTSLLFNENIKTLELKQDLLQKRLKEMESGVKNGIIKSSESDKILAESLSTQQQLLELGKEKLKMLHALEILTGQKISEKSCLFIPDSLNTLVTTIRPEFRFFDSEAARIEKSVKLKSAQNLPKLYAFGQLGYSYPGLNFFENKSDYYYMIGAKMSWTIFDWKQVNREKIGRAHV
jgi:outer membrane protein TolC